MDVFKSSLLFLLCFGLLLSSVNAGSYGDSSDDWNVVDGVLIGAKYNDSSLIYEDMENRLTPIPVCASDFLFVYNNRVSTSYEGDTGLKYSMFVDTLTGYRYHFDESMTRGIAYVTKGKFDIKNFSLTRWHKDGDDFYRLFGNYHDNITLDNGTVIRALYITDDLTVDEKLYFDDYDTQLYKYYEDKKIEEMKDMQDYIADLDDDMIRRSSNNKQSGHYSGYTSGGSYMYGRYY